jgi:hypothetical protein
MARFTVWFMNLATLFESKHWLDLRLVIITNYEKKSLYYSGYRISNSGSSESLSICNSISLLIS